MPKCFEFCVFSYIASAHSSRLQLTLDEWNKFHTIAHTCFNNHFQFEPSRCVLQHEKMYIVCSPEKILRFNFIHNNHPHPPFSHQRSVTSSALSLTLACLLVSLYFNYRKCSIVGTEESERKKQASDWCRLIRRLIHFSEFGAWLWMFKRI